MGLKPKYESRTLGVRDLLKKAPRTTTKTIKTHKLTKHKLKPAKKSQTQTWRFIEDKTPEVFMAWK